MNHIWRIKKPYFLQLSSGEKSVEIRVGYANIQKVHVGDTITFENYGPNKFCVSAIKRYNDFASMLASEGVSRVLPGHSEASALKALRAIYPPDKERLGIYAFHLRNMAAEDRRFYSASELAAKSHKLFSRIVAESYNITDWISEDYPKHFEHYWTKYVPGIITGEREIIAVYVNRHIAGTVILKKAPDEKKVCTLFISEEYRERGLATALLEHAFAWLGTTTPLITIADYKVDKFAGLIKKYGWQLTQVLEGHYNDHSAEYVYNGEIK